MSGMKVTWLGQAGLMFEKDGTRVMIDPYFSDSVGKIDPSKRRRVEADMRFIDLLPDVLIFTHDHLDHYDPETADMLFTKAERMTVLCPSSVWQKARVCGKHNYVLFDSGTEWTEKNFRFTAVRTKHSDPCAIGVVIRDLGTHKNYYVTGDTLYSEEIFRDLPKEISAVFLPVNGVGNNMNMTDAARFAEKTGAKKVVPVHFGMFDDIDPRGFTCGNEVIIPEIYREIKL